MPTRYFENKETSDTRLFCLPYAGGNAEFYLSWKRLVPKNIDLCPIQLSGRSYLMKEELPSNISLIADSCVKIIEKYSDKKVVLYGHSMGSILAYEIALKLNFKLDLVCLSGGDAPHIWGNKEFYSRFTDEELLKWMINNYNYHLNDMKLAESYLAPFIRVLREDLKNCESYVTSGKILDCPVIIFGAKDDALCSTDLNLWRQYCPQAIVHYFENGGHFFHKAYANEIISIIETALT